VPDEVLRDELLPNERPSWSSSIIKARRWLLSFSMILRRRELESGAHREITAFGGCGTTSRASAAIPDRAPRAVGGYPLRGRADRQNDPKARFVAHPCAHTPRTRLERVVSAMARMFCRRLKSRVSSVSIVEPVSAPEIERSQRSTL